TGVPGTSVDTDRTKAAKEVFAKYPGIHIIASAPGMWSQAVARTALTKIVTTHPWKDINGLWMQVGCYTANSMEKQAGIPDSKLRACAGEGSNGHRIQMLPVGDKTVKGAHDTYRPMGAPSISYASPPYSGALALKLAVQILEGKKVPKLTKLPLPLVTNASVKLCQKGAWMEMEAGCNVFQPAIISNPGWFASIYSPQTPEVGLQAASTVRRSSEHDRSRAPRSLSSIGSAGRGRVYGARSRSYRDCQALRGDHCSEECVLHGPCRRGACASWRERRR
ncbi:substrate-binding domain-containing protein, partial [Acidiphilium sp. JA12-A1]|uniref:substrate-binding domain-containing protein n=1 Tax=Acidiphilium sp. JA12-A1 TaxID=1464546 RepID=UPI00128F6A4A